MKNETKLSTELLEYLQDEVVEAWVIQGIDYRDLYNEGFKPEFDAVLDSVPEMLSVLGYDHLEEWIKDMGLTDEFTT